MNVALYYEPDGYVESRGGTPGGPAGLMGRQVAGREFLDAYLSHGSWNELAGVVRSRDRAASLVDFCKRHPSNVSSVRTLRVVEEAAFLQSPVPVLHHPCPPDVRFAWMRHALAPHRFALCGLTHTLASVAGTNAICDLVSAPFETYDRLICTSRAVVRMVNAVADSFAAYLREQFGGAPGLRAKTALVPLGVNVDRFRPPTDDERRTSRQMLTVAEDEALVLCVGRLSHHAKAHPFPAFQAAQRAARESGRKVHLAFAGWAAHPTVAAEYRNAARFFAPAARVSFWDGQDPTVRSRMWHAADVFISLPDNIQETFGLVVVEAMASGLPVVASDWDGYRDLVDPGQTGWLVPTRMVRGATEGSTSRLLFGAVNYDNFLAEVVQSVAVDAGAAGEALTRLVGDESLRKRMGTAGRARVLERFAWPHVIRAYEAIWAEQREELAAQTPTAPRAPVRYPTPDVSFAGYPSEWLDEATPLRATEGAASRLAALLAMPLTNMAADRRCSEPEVLLELLQHAGTVSELASRLESKGSTPAAARATLAWLLKYGLLE